MNFKEPINIGELDAAQRLELARNPELFIAKRRIAELERVRVLSDEEIMDIVYADFYDIDGGYCCDIMPDKVVAAIRKVVVAARPIPEGFALVPVEPTPEMLKATKEIEVGAFDWRGDREAIEDYQAAEVYKAMLAAAPKGGSHE